MNATIEPAPAAPPPGPLPAAAYRRMVRVLRLGLLVALGVLAGALGVLVARSPGSSSGSWIAANPLVRYLDVAALGHGLAAGAPEAYLTLGVYALVATPVLRVVSGLSSFHAHGERRMAALSSAVLALLLLGLFVLGPLVR